MINTQADKSTSYEPQENSNEISFTELQSLQASEAEGPARNLLSSANVIIATTTHPNKDRLIICGTQLLVDVLDLSYMHEIRRLTVALRTAADLPQLVSLVAAVKGQVDVDAFVIERFGKSATQ
jgi:hypothetical protein